MKKQLNSYSRFNTTPACDRQTDRQTQDDSKYHASIASCGKKGKVFPYSLPSVGPGADPSV